MSDHITFSVRTRRVTYGDRRKFIEYRILFRHVGEIVGVEDGPRRETKTRAAALKAARSRIAVLRTRRLFAIKVTRKHIVEGDARSCSSCAIALALWHNQERMGLSRREYNIEVAPYGFMAWDLGIRLLKRYGDDGSLLLPIERLPDMVVPGSSPQFYPDNMEEWAMQWDDWAEARYMTAKEWRDNRDPDGKPGRPGPASFILDLDDFQPMVP